MGQGIDRRSELVDHLALPFEMFQAIGVCPQPHAHLAVVIPGQGHRSPVIDKDL